MLPLALALGLFVSTTNIAYRPLPPAELKKLLDEHVCTTNAHSDIEVPGFVEGLRVHIWELQDSTRHHAFTYVGQHHVDGVAPLLVAGIGKRGLQDQVEVAHVLSSLPDLPDAETLLREGASIEDATVRAIFVRAVDDTADAPRAVSALRAVRPAEKDAGCALVMDLVAAKLGGAPEADAAKKALARLDVQEVREIMSTVDALAPAPQLAPLFASWLDDKRPVGTLSHRETKSYVVRDFGVWAVHVLGVKLDPPLTHMVHADAAVVAKTKKALTSSAKP